jgi:Flp pilus assembly protein TadD
VTVRLRGGGGDAFRAGNEAAENGDFNEATSQFRKAVLENPGSADAHFNLAVCLEVQGDVAAAHEQYRKAHELDASDAEAAAGARRTERLLWAMQKTSNP